MSNIGQALKSLDDAYPVGLSLAVLLIAVVTLIIRMQWHELFFYTNKMEIFLLNFFRNVIDSKKALLDFINPGLSVY